MSEASTISKTQSPNTMSTISQGLIDLGVENGDTLLVHSSLSSLGWVCGGAQTVIMALRRAVGEDGTLVMPAHSGDWSDPAEWGNPPVPSEWVPIIYDNMPAYDPGITPTRGMGKIAELFRTFPGTIRSSHPQVSFSANGRLANQIVGNHSLTPQLGMSSPLGRMYELNAKVLLLGVGYGSCTSFHLAETLIDETPVQQMGSAIYEDGRRIWKWFSDYCYDADDFCLLGKDFEQNFHVHKGMIGNADCLLFDLKNGVDYAKEWLIKNRFNKPSM